LFLYIKNIDSLSLLLIFYLTRDRIPVLSVMCILFF